MGRTEILIKNFWSLLRASVSFAGIWLKAFDIENLECEPRNCFKCDEKDARTCDQGLWFREGKMFFKKGENESLCSAFRNINSNGIYVSRA